MAIFWKPEPDPARYAQLAIASYAAIKAACPDAKVAFGSLASFGPPNIFNTWNFLASALAAEPNLCDSFDVLSLHPYTWLQEVSAEHDEWLDFESTINSQTAMVAIARQMLADAGCAPKPIWFTEVGWPSYQLSEEKVALFAIRSFLLTAMDGVEAWCWYTFWDREPTNEGIRPHENYFGTFGWPGEDGTVRRAKPSWNAIVATLTRIGTFRYAGSLNSTLNLPDDVYVLAFVNDEEDIVLAGWDGRDMPDITSGGTAEGGEDTVTEIDIPLPTGITGTILYDIYGTETAREAAAPSIHLTLTPSVQLLVVEK